MLLIQNGLVFTMETNEESCVDLLIEKEKIIKIAKKIIPRKKSSIDSSPNVSLFSSENN